MALRDFTTVVKDPGPAVVGTWVITIQIIGKKIIVIINPDIHVADNTCNNYPRLLANLTLASAFSKLSLMKTVFKR